MPEIIESDTPLVVPQFCDRDGARHPTFKNDKGDVIEGHPIGCGALLPPGSFYDSWMEQIEEGPQDGAIVRAHGRFIPGGHTCEKCGTKYHASIADRMKATAPTP